MLINGWQQALLVDPRGSSVSSHQLIALKAPVRSSHTRTAFYDGSLPSEASSLLLVVPINLKSVLSLLLTFHMRPIYCCLFRFRRVPFRGFFAQNQVEPICNKEQDLSQTEPICHGINKEPGIILIHRGKRCMEQEARLKRNN